MLRPRITPCLLIQNGGLVKTVGFAAPRYVGDPINVVRIFNEKEVDELMVLDIDATAHGRTPNLRLIEQLAGECRMPLCYGGGTSRVDEALQIMALGVEKIAISAAAIARPALVAELSDRVGRQSVVVVLDVKRTGEAGRYEIFTHNGRRPTGIELIDFARRVEADGAGEIVVNSIDNDGLMVGYDLELAARVRAAVALPISILGGAGKIDHLKSLVARCGVVGAAAGSMFVFKGTLRAVLISYPSQADRDRITASQADYGLRTHHA